MFVVIHHLPTPLNILKNTHRHTVCYFVFHFFDISDWGCFSTLRRSTENDSILRNLILVVVVVVVFSSFLRLAFLHLIILKMLRCIFFFLFFYFNINFHNHNDRVVVVYRYECMTARLHNFFEWIRVDYYVQHYVTQLIFIRWHCLKFCMMCIPYLCTVHTCTTRNENE